MSRAPHRIRRQTWLVRARTQADGFAARAALRDAWANGLAATFESAFDDASPNGTVLRIPRLELRVRVSGTDALQDGLPEIIAAQLIEQLHLAQARHTSGAHAAAPAATEVSPEASALATLRHYLDFGTLPWSSGSQPVADVVRELGATAHANIVSIVMWLAEHATEPALFRLLQLLAGDWQACVDALPSRVPALVRRAVLVLAAPTGGASRDVPSDEHERLRTASALLTAALRTSTADASTQSVLDTVLPPRESATPRQAHTAIPADARDAEAHAFVARAARATEAHADAESEADLIVRAVMQSEPLAPHLAPLATPVPSAGLVILHPFVGTVFERRGVRREMEIPAESLPRAAAVLHYLATGRTTVHELELPLVKVFLGLTPETPLPVAHGTLHADDIDECDTLLRAVIAHWSALGRTSPNGLRGTFLSRPGLLRHEDARWALHVEASPFDVLLDRLPWGVAIVKLPWMPEPLHVQWTR